MLISKEVKITADWASVKKYESLGYGKMKQGDTFIIKIEDLKPNSGVIVDITCDYCGVLIKRKFSEYVRNIKIDGKFCCRSCSPIRYRETCLRKYGVTNTSKLSQTHEKIKSTNLKRYGVESFAKLESFKENHKLRMIKKYGVDSFSKTEEWLEKQKQTSLERFGVENASQCAEIFSKQQKSRYEIFEFKNTGLFYQGTFELDFLNNYYDRFEIKKGPIIEYEFENSNKQYFSDFYLPKFNLIIEIKSTYTFHLAKEKNIEKQKKSISLGYGHIFIVDKKYQEFESLLRK